MPAVSGGSEFSSPPVTQWLEERIVLFHQKTLGQNEGASSELSDHCWLPTCPPNPSATQSQMDTYPRWQVVSRAFENTDY